MSDAERDFWTEAQRRICKEVSKQNYDTWIKPVRLLSFKGSGVVLGVPNRFFKEWLLDHYFEVLTRILMEVFEKEDINLSFKIHKGDKADREEPGRGPEAVSAGDGGSGGAQGQETKQAASVPAGRGRQHGLNPKYNFANFVVGPSNQFAHAAALAVAESPGKAYNPLFIYGGVGLGKTHLLNAICGYVKERSPRMRTTLLTSEEFTNELIAAIHYNRMTEFRNKYRNTDVLVIDDIQFIAGKERTQEEFFHTFNTLHEDFKQIVLSSDRIPKDMPDMEERLRSRFEWGLIADIQAPDLETKVAIVEKKAAAEGITVPKDVAMFLATNIKSNIRELEGSLIRLGAYASLTGREVNIELARAVLRDVVIEKNRVMGLEQIIKMVAERYSVKVSELKSKRRTRTLVIPRQIAMYLCHNVAGASLPEVGRTLGGKDHTTVLHACRQVVERRGADVKYDAELEALTRAVKG